MWGNSYPSNLKKLCSLQNKCIRCMFFAEVESHPKFSINFLIFLNLITLLNWVHAYLHIKIFSKSSSIPSLFYDSLRAVSIITCTSITPDHRPKVRTNTGKFTFAYVASKVWETVPTNLKRLSTSSFKKRYKIIYSIVSQFLFFWNCN